MSILLFLVFVIFVIAGIWKAFEKAGEPGWAAIVPIYNYYVMARIGGVKNWWLIFIPIANIIIIIMIIHGISKSFGKDIGFTLGLLFLGFIFWPILGFGDAQYVGPDGVNILDKDINEIGKI